MADLGMSQSQLELRAFGRAGNTAIQNLKKGASPAFDRVADMARALGLELYLGLPRRNDNEDVSEASGSLREDLGGTNFIAIPWFSEEQSSGAVPVAIDRAWLIENALAPEALSAVAPDASLIADVDPKGLVAIVESGAPRRGAGQPWCLVQNGKYVIARVAWLDRHFVIMPPQVENAPQLFEHDHPESPRPVGRVACLLMVVGR